MDSCSTNQITVADEPSVYSTQSLAKRVQLPVSTHERTQDLWSCNYEGVIKARVEAAPSKRKHRRKVQSGTKLVLEVGSRDRTNGSV